VELGFPVVHRIEVVDVLVPILELFHALLMIFDVCFVRGPHLAHLQTDLFLSAPVHELLNHCVTELHLDLLAVLSR
jgi:hypothetical protein